MDVLESSTRENMPALRSFEAVMCLVRTGESGKQRARTDFVHEGIEFFLGAQWDDKHFGGCDDGRKREDLCMVSKDPRSL